MVLGVAAAGFVVLLSVSVHLPSATRAQCTGSLTDPYLQVHVRNGYVLYPSWAKLKCDSSCPLPDRPSYIWYKNGQKTNEGTQDYSAYFDHADSVSCAVKGREDFPAPPVCVHDQTCNKVTYSERSICATKGSSVDISCTYNHHGAANIRSKFWFSPDRSHQWLHPPHSEDVVKDSQDAGRVQVLETERGRSTLRIRDLTESDSAEYRFKFTTGSFEWRSSLPGTTLTVTALQVQVTRISVHPFHTEAELKCHSSCSPEGHYSYVWFKNGQKNMTAEGPSYEDRFNPEDHVSCAFKGLEDYCSASLYPSKIPAASVSPSGEIVEGNSVTLTCRADPNSAARNAWNKGNQALSLGSAGVYHLTSVSSEDRGMYHCKSEGKHFMSLFIDVQYAPKLPSVSVSPPGGKIVEGSSVTLTCSSDANPAAKYTWYKENVKIPPIDEAELVFSSIQSSDSGQYYCAAENKLGRKTSGYISINVKYAPKTSSVSVSPSGTIMEGSSVTLICSSDANPAAKFSWYKKDKQQPRGKGAAHRFTSIRSEDRGNYFCKSQNKYGEIQSAAVLIDVQYAPKLPSVSVSPSAEIVEGSSVILTCSSDANPAAKYTWYKENQTRPHGQERFYHFTSISSEDRGDYYCKSENRHGHITSESVHVDVQYAPKLPSVSSSPSAEIVEGSSVTLTCSSDANPAANYTWYKEKQKELHGPTGIYHFTSISSEDRANYYCKSENQHGQITSSSHFIDVQYAPKLPSVSASAPGGEIVEGSSVTLTCSSDANPAANYTWYKENEDAAKASGQNFTITDFRHEHSGNYSCEAQNTRGRHNSTSYPLVVAAPPLWNSAVIINIIRLSLAVVILVPLLRFCLLMRKKKTRSSTTEPDEAVETLELSEMLRT